MTNPLTADTITDEQIRALRAEAVAAGDAVGIFWCEVALGLERATRDDGTPLTAHDARQACADVINAARAMGEG
jgi:hypothetical protein